MKILIFIFMIVSASLSVFFFDHQISVSFSNEYFKEHYWQFFRTMTDLGLGEIYFSIAIGTYVTAKFLFKNDYYRKWSLNFFICLLTSGITLQLAKHIVGRQRPLQTVDFNPFVFQPFNFDWYFHSMPSGHSQVIFCAAALFSVAFPKWKWLWFVFATFIAFTRIATQQHWLSDAIIGAYIGWGVSFLTLQWLSKYPNLNLQTK